MPRASLYGMGTIAPVETPAAPNGANLLRVDAGSQGKPARAPLFHGFVGTPVQDQLRLIEQALSQLRESVVITTNDLETPGPLIVYVNPAFTRMTGWEPEDLVGKNPRILQGEKTTRKTLDRLRAQLQKGEAFEGHDINYRKDGTPFHIDWYIEPLRDVSGAINYWVAVQRDVTERNELQAQLLHAQRMEGLGLLASGIAHDLNNVLAPVRIACDVLCDRVVDEDGKQFLQLLQSSAKRGVALVKQILSFARGITGGTGLVEPRLILCEMAAMARATFPKGIEIVEDLGENLASIEMDPTQLHQVLLNLCVNARDAIGESGQITLRGRNVTLAEPLRTARGTLAPGDYVLLEVADTGDGMPPEVEAKIFDAFFSTKAPGEGTGLGLSTVAMIVQNQRGAIGLTTELGKGTTFSIYLPAIEPQPEIKLDEKPIITREGAGRSVLVASDTAAVAQIMRETLEGAGYKVTVESADKPLSAALQTCDAEIAVIDLPASASAPANELRDLRRRYPKMRIVAISNLSAEEPKPTMPEVDAILEKPFTLGALRKAVSG